MDSISNEYLTAPEIQHIPLDKIKCRFCLGFYIDPMKNVEHNENCVFRLSDVFLAFNGKLKFACTVCRDIFDRATELNKHERRHKLPGGYICTICKEKFLTDADRDRHKEHIHKVFKCLLCENDALMSSELSFLRHLQEKHPGKNGRYAICSDCGACFEQKSYLRLHNESRCGQSRSLNCRVCGAKFLTEDELDVHKIAHKMIGGKQNIVSLTKQRKRKISSESEPNDSITHDIDVFNGNMAIADGESDQEQIANDTNDETVLKNRPASVEIKSDEDEVEDMRPNKIAKRSADDVSDSASKNGDEDDSLDSSDDDNQIDPETSKADARRKSRRKPLSAQLYACKYCSSKYTSLTRHENHIKCHGPDGKLIHKCLCCPFYFATNDELKKHRTEAHGNDLTCHICGKTYKSREYIGRHIRQAHKNKSTKTVHMCTKCGTSFVNKTSLQYHENSDCGRLPTFKCDQCGKLLHSPHTLKAHQSIHTGVKSHLCTYCGKACRTKVQLLSHTRIHTGEKPYQCKYCDRRFCDRSTKLTHETTHTGIKPYMCQGCGDRFSCISNLQSHRRARKTTCGLLPLVSKAFPQLNVIVTESGDKSK